MAESLEKIWLGVLLGAGALLIVLVYRDLASDDGPHPQADPPAATAAQVPPTPQGGAAAAQLHLLIEGQRENDLRLLLSQLDFASAHQLLNEVHQGYTSAMKAASVGNTAVLTMLLEAGADPAIHGGSERTALQYAVEKNRIEAARLLIAAGVDINGVDETRLSPLVMAIDRGYSELAYLLLDAGADTNIQHVAGYTALIDAARNGDMAMVKALIEQGADPSARLPDGRTAADLAQQLEHFEIAVYLKALE